MFACAIVVAMFRAAVGKNRQGALLAAFALLAGCLTALAIIVATVAFGFTRNCYS